MIQEKSKIQITEPIQFALDEVYKSLESLYSLYREASTILEIEIDGQIPAQGYRLTCEKDKFTIIGADEAGVMYGLLDLANEIRHQKGIEGIISQEITPYLENRGIKINIPLDARTPSYSDSSDSAAYNIETMWEFSFWTEFLDRMALNKYNVLSLWSLSPFPSLVRIPEYPLTALDDVKRTTRPFKAELSGWGIYAKDLEKSLITVRKMTIEEKIEFWKSVMEYARKRCIKVYIFTWNLFTYGTENSPYGITCAQDNPITKDYVYCGTKALLNTYPLLAGIGVTAGEHMSQDGTDISFIADTYGRGVKDVLVNQPDREFRFIHRMQYTSYESIIEEFQEFPCPFEISLKYSQAHMYSTTKPKFINQYLQVKSPEMKIWLTVRNDDFYLYRWGNPKFAAEYLKNMPVDTMTGYYMGADGITWGRDYSDVSDLSHPLFVAKMWYMYFIWGQLSYNINLPESYFKKEIENYSGIKGSALYDSWKNASDIIPEVNCTHWHDFDFQWYPEGCCMYEQDVDKLVFADINEFISCKSVPKGEYYSVMDFCKVKISQDTITKITPLEVAESIWKHADKAIEGIQEIEKDAKLQKELKDTIEDILTLSYLGYYYSSKMRAAVALYLYRLKGEKELQVEAVQLLQNASILWKQYSAKSMERYKPQVLTRLCGYLDLQRFDELSELDIKLALED